MMRRKDNELRKLKGPKCAGISLPLGALCWGENKHTSVPLWFSYEKVS